MKIYNANGNRFLIGEDDIDVVKMCEKYQCDGYLKVHSHQMTVINADGSKANLCVNGLHCFTHYLYDMNSEYKIYALVIENEVYKSEILNVKPFISRVTVKNPIVQRNFVDVGNQHLVLINHDLIEAKNLCERFECNINYVYIRDRKCIEVITYEKGVGFTKSCGSGNIASFAYVNENDLCDSQVIVVNQGGICSIHRKDKVEMTTMSIFEGEYENY